MDYFWTQHALYKSKQYGLSEQRIKRVIRAPYRTEEGIVKNTIAVMVPVGNFKISKKEEKPSWKQEIWAMYQIPATRNSQRDAQNKTKYKKMSGLGSRVSRVKIISVWRYPGVSPKNNPIPEEILREITSKL